MKIACIGNMNNMMFPLARYLKDVGHDVTLFLLDEYNHFLPKSDVFEEVDITLTSLGWNKFSFGEIKPKKIKEIFNGFDFYIGMHWAPAYLLKGGIKLDIFFPVGSDLFQFPFSRLKEATFLQTIAGAQGWRCSKYQYYGVRYASAISMDKNANYDNFLNIIKTKHTSRISAFPFLYLKQYTPDYFNKSDLKEVISRHREETKVLIVQQTRQEWKCGPQSWHYKGNEIFLKGFADFVRKHGNPSVKILLFEYGTDLEASKDLIEDLNIKQYVIWLPPSERKHIIGAISMCDVGVGQIGHSHFSYGSVFEIISLGKIFIGRRDYEDYKDKVLYPMWCVKNVSDVEVSLSHIYENFESEQKKALEGKNWIKKYAEEIPLSEVEELLNKKTVPLHMAFIDKVSLKMADLSAYLMTSLYSILLKVNRLKHLVKQSKYGS